MANTLLLDLSHTAHTQARTGVQRVARSIFRALGGQVLAITHDPHRSAWRALEPWENANLNHEGAAMKRGARWPLAARLRGRLQRSLRRQEVIDARLLPLARSASGLLIPEIFSPTVAAALPGLFAATAGPRVAIFHDAIALQYPELTPPKTVARFPAYLAELLTFDGVAAVSDDSRECLLDYWRWLGTKSAPPVVRIALGMDTQRVSAGGEKFPTDASARPVVLCVGSVEARKNHVALLDACEALWSGGARFTLHLIGLVQPQTGASALLRIRRMQAAGRPLRYDGPVSDAVLDAAYSSCAFTVYPSLVEGFGLPILESLAHGRPCICSGRRALGEAARGGGCVMLDDVDPASLAAAIKRLLDSPEEITALAREARRRRFRAWSEYVDDLRAWMRELPRR